MKGKIQRRSLNKGIESGSFRSKGVKLEWSAFLLTSFIAVIHIRIQLEGKEPLSLCLVWSA